MEIRNLESFIQTAEQGSFTKAAAKLGYTQSSVSLQIKQLERELGVSLFDRVNHTVRLTAKGLEILELAHQVIRTADAMKAAAESPQSIRGSIRIAMASSISHVLFKNRFDEFRSLFPHLSLQVFQTSTEEMFRMLNRNEADLVYTLDYHIYDRNYVIASEEPVTCHFVASACHPLSAHRSVSVDELLEWPFILTEKGMSYRRILDESLASRSMAVDPVLEIGDTALISAMLENGRALSFLPDYVTDEDVRLGRLFRLDTPDIQITIWKQLLYHRNKWVPPEMQAVIDYLSR
ncbi:MAG: LysR family transcriptional regulator [Lachnospiraceae bacterium]|uniref:LysR family transcriptional regulator n=1 Tax=Parablautia sp. Marseille-Q6255 TaxID=3039593 RepID=UPI0024BD0729|nr:LysR family transcriptional regulator [Parablautia sp. Marseille-Q6255]